MKRKIALILSCLTLMSCLVIGASAKSVTRRKSNSEFGTLTGKQEYHGKTNGQKVVSYWVQISKGFSNLYIKLDVCNAGTGKKLDSVSDHVYGSAYFPDYYGKSSAINKYPVSSFGAHEARGKTSLVVYTTLSNY